MDQNNLTPEESFAIINKSIANFKMNYKESANIFLLWGWMLTLANFSHFIILKVLHAREAYHLMGMYSILNWVVFVGAAFLIQFFMMRKMERSKKVYNHLDKYLKRLWQVTAVSFFIGAFVCIRLQIVPVAIMLLIAGIATTTSGLLIKFKPLAIGGATFFIFSIAATFATNEYIALVSCVAIICGYLIPGYFLKSAK